MISEKLIQIAENEPRVYEAGKADGVEQGFEQGSQEGYTKGYEAGKKSEYDEFWDNFQDYGNRTTYNSAFTPHWTNQIFKPKYDIRPTGTYGDSSMFYQNRKSLSPPLDIAAGLAYNGVRLDMSQATRWDSTFNSASVINIPPLDAQSCVLMNYTFQSCTATEVTINNLRADCAFKNTFYYHSALVNLTLTGTIGQNGLNLQWSTKLSKASIISVISHLSDTTSGLTVTLSKTAVDNAFEGGSGGGEFHYLIDSKENWTISLI